MVASTIGGDGRSSCEDVDATVMTEGVSIVEGTVVTDNELADAVGRGTLTNLDGDDT